MKAILVLEDGTSFYGKSFGATGETFGEVVFNTCMTGYEEILTDPSYKGQIVTMTYPLIGNYGFNEIDSESMKPHVQGFIVKEICEEPSNWRAKLSPKEYFNKYNVVAITEVDTRSLTKHIRKYGSMNAVISTERFSIEELQSSIKEWALYSKNPVEEVSTKTQYSLYGKGKKVAVLDFGIKQNILRSLNREGCDLHIFPHNATAEEILSISPDGILLSNGPGDPKDLHKPLETVKSLLGKKPIMGICLGHQLLGLALGGKTYKLKFGHHGGNHPVKDYTTGRVYITSQNHNYALEDGFCSDIKITHVNVNDGTVEGFKHNQIPILAVQYHPEAAPGPQDSFCVFYDFMKLMEDNKNA